LHEHAHFGGAVTDDDDDSSVSLRCVAVVTAAMSVNATKQCMIDIDDDSLLFEPHHGFEVHSTTQTYIAINTIAANDVNADSMPPPPFVCTGSIFNSLSVIESYTPSYESTLTLGSSDDDDDDERGGRVGRRRDDSLLLLLDDSRALDCSDDDDLSDDDESLVEDLSDDDESLVDDFSDDDDESPDDDLSEDDDDDDLTM
jgi:hypothetical protein